MELRYLTDRLNNNRLERNNYTGSQKPLCYMINIYIVFRPISINLRNFLLGGCRKIKIMSYPALKEIII